MKKNLKYTILLFVFLLVASIFMYIKAGYENCISEQTQAFNRNYGDAVEYCDSKWLSQQPYMD